MHCYNHPTQSAIGVCKVCGKGLCNECAADLGHSLACKSHHEALAADMAALMQRSIKLQTTAKKSIYVAPAFFGFMGACFVAFGLSDNSKAAIFFDLMGGAFVVFALVLLVLNRRAYAATGHDKV
jgi:hypothetical protein